MKNKTIIFIIVLILALVILTTYKMDTKTKVLIDTNMGSFTIELYDDMPITAGNFEKLVKQGFYNGVIFHRVIDGFMIQGGDPTGTGSGGPGYTIKDEFKENSNNNRGTISMANAGQNTGGSQFFINLVNNNFLDEKHPAFGKVTKGMEVVDKIGKVEKDANDKPLQEVKIIKAEIIQSHKLYKIKFIHNKMEKDIGKINKNDTTDIIFRIDDFGGRTGLTIREFVTSERYTGFTKSGVRILAADFPKFKEMINSVKEEDLKEPEQSSEEKPEESKEKLPDY